MLHDDDTEFQNFPYSFIQLDFDQTVSIRESFFPSPSLTTLMADLGGCLGLWLGVGIVQLCVHGLNLAKQLQGLKSLRPK